MNDFNYYTHNWWKIELDELPTKGIFYNKNTLIKVRSLSVLEVKFLATLVPQNATAVCNEILSKCLYLEHIKLDEILLPDREYLIFWIRLNSFTQSNGYEINIGSCQWCHESFSTKVPLNKFGVNYIKTYKNEIMLPDANIKLEIAVPKFNDSLYSLKNEIDSIALWINAENTFNEKVKWIENLSAMDFMILKDAIDDCKCGMNHNVNVICPCCGKQNNITIILNDDALFGKVELMQVLESISRIAKYANLQITNDWSWPEVEAEQIVINKMIAEENEANQKELARARNQANSVRGSMPSTPHTSMPHL